MIDISRLFSQILKPSLGCTDPASVALGVAAAAQAAAGWTPSLRNGQFHVQEPFEIRSVRVVVNRNLLKQSFSIPIPNGAGHRGLVMASALGLFCDPRKELELFSSLDPSRIRAAEEIAAAGKVVVSIHPEVKAELHVDATVELRGKAGWATGACAVRHEHANITALSQNGVRIYSKELAARDAESGEADAAGIRNLSIVELTAIVEVLPESVLELIGGTVEMNMRASQSGQERPMGLGTGFHAGRDGEPLDTFHLAANMAAAASDVRMSGHPVPVMSSAGSGNQGIIATVPVVVYSRQKGIDESRMLRAVALSHLMTMYLTSHIGYLSALCGVAIKAGIGAACGIVYAKGGGAEDIGRAIKVMAASLAGMICDGAKGSCALKVGTASDMAIRSAILACRKVEVPDDSGIVGLTAEDTVRNLAALGASMDTVDDKILEIMTAKIGPKPEKKGSACSSVPRIGGEPAAGADSPLDPRLRWNMF
jgi:L-cysteine desulfidase